MTSYTCENWTLEDVASALNNMHKDGKVIVVPMFQRGKRWRKEQERTFIDSMYKGYPVGTMLYYKKIDNGVETYILVDGLQRGNTIRKYMRNPTEFYSLNEISDEKCMDILHVLDIEGTDISPIKIHLLKFIKEQKRLKFSATVYFKLSKDICAIYGKEENIECQETIIEMLESLFLDGQNQYESIAKSIIPVIVYNGEESNLPEIFERINSKGIALNVYEVYAASWPIDKRFKVNNQEIVDAVVRKYDMLASDGYHIANYDRDRLHYSKELNAFEFLFGMGKYLTQKYPNLSFNTKADDDTVNPLAFELINACLNDGDKISTLYDKVL